MNLDDSLNLEVLSGKGIVVRLRDPKTWEFLGTEDDPATVTVLGCDNSKWKAAKKKIESERKQINTSLTQEEKDDITIRCLAECTLDTTLEFNGEKPKDYYKDMYKREGFHWITEQVLVKATTRQSLIEEAKKNSMTE